MKVQICAECGKEFWTDVDDICSACARSIDEDDDQEHTEDDDADECQSCAGTGMSWDGCGTCRECGGDGWL